MTGSRSGGTTFDLLVVRGVNEFSEFSPTDNLAAAGTHWGGLTGSESVLSKVRLAAAVSGNIPGTVDPPPNETEIGNVTCGSIVRLQVGTSSTNGKIGKPVRTIGSIGNPSVVVIGEIQVNEISETGSVVATNGGVIASVRCGSALAPGGGWLAGTIVAGQGSIDFIDVFGSIGSPTHPATIEAYYGIKSIIVHPDGDGLPQPVWADIDASTADSLVDFALLRCGDFTGTFHAGTGANLSSVDTPEIFIDGDLAGPLTFEGELRIPIRIEGACLPGSSINIGGSVLASITSEGDLADILIEGDVLSQSGQPDIHIRSDTGRIEEIKVYGNILSDDADGSGHNIFLEAAEGFGWIEARSIVAFIGSPLGAGNFVPIDHLSSVPGGAVSEFDAEVWCSSFETFDIENPVGNLVQLGHIINFLEVPAGARARFAGVSTSPPGFDGTIRIHAIDGLKGQLIFNADAIPNLNWEDYDGEVQILGAAQFETLAMPGYTRPASTFGGGAAGLVPFLLHGPDCVPATTQSPPTLCAGGFRNGTAPITLTFKGPVAFDGQHPITIEMFGGDPGEWLPIATQSYRARRDEQDHRQHGLGERAAERRCRSQRRCGRDRRRGLLLLVGTRRVLTSDSPEATNGPRDEGP